MPLRRSLSARLFPEALCPWLAAGLLLLAALLRITFLVRECPLDLASDEAHYWDWSRHLDWSYYSKGPLVAWLIWASCAVFGDLAEAFTGSLMPAVRLPAVICGTLLLTAIYRLTVEITARPRLALAVVAVALTLPLVAAGSLLMTIDSPYTCCWAWALVFAYRAIRGRSAMAWELTGLCVGIGILAKYTMIVFLPSLGLFLLFSPPHRRLLLSGGFWSMVGIAMLCCVPILVWNAQHDWVTFLHVRRLAGLAAPGEVVLRQGDGTIRWLGPLHYLGGQAGILLGYWLLVWFCAMVWYNPWREKDTGCRFLWWLSVPMFLLFAGFSLKTGGGEPNWPVTAYISGGVLSAVWVCERLSSRSWLLRTTTACCVLLACGLGLSATLLVHRSDLVQPWLSELAGPPTAERPFPTRRFDPSCRLRGWRTLAAEVDVVRQRLTLEDGQEPVLVCTNWSLPGMLGVYCQGHPQAHSIGLLQGDRHSQYDFWDGPVNQPGEYVGRTFLIVGTPQPEILAAFERVEPFQEVRYSEGNTPIAAWLITVGRGLKRLPPRPTASAH